MALPSQRGASLLFSLLALVALTLAAVALVRSVDTGALVIGNLGFKLDATSATDLATERAIGWLNARQAAVEALDNDLENDGYYASSLDALDPAGNGTDDARVVVDWNWNECAGARGAYSRCLKPLRNEIANNDTGNRSRYVITRLCAVTGSRSAGGNACAAPVGDAGGADKNRNAPRVGGGRIATPATSPFYRIVVRTVGARDTVSVTETIVHF